ncbi:hypothetical protein U9M48_006743 [Paspalum notatum var. saurae]|uniref:Uncharacterized protein n=1 Tax=Paspalum notatum var. saurae TaxID=547442 RepID=A0AAQ3PYL5_PASNO
MLPGLALPAGLHLHLGHLDEGLLELALPPAGDVGIVLHHLGRRRRGEQRGVGREEHLVRDHVLVVLVVERVGGEDVLVHGGVVGRGWVGRAPPPEQVGEPGADVGGDGEAIGDEGRAVGAADRVRAREHHHVLGVEPLGGEAADEVGDVEGGWRQVVQGIGGAGDAPIQAAGGHVDLHGEPAEEVGGVTGCEGDDVGTGDRARAGLLDGVLGRVDDLEAAQAGEVGRAQLLRLWVRRRRVQEHRAVTSLLNQSSCQPQHIHYSTVVCISISIRRGAFMDALHSHLNEAVVEEHADEAGAEAGVLVDELLHLVADNVLHAGARFLVVAHLQALAGRRGQNQGPCHRYGKPERSGHRLVSLAALCDNSRAYKRQTQLLHGIGNGIYCNAPAKYRLALFNHGFIRFTAQNHVNPASVGLGGLSQRAKPKRKMQTLFYKKIEGTTIDVQGHDI